jgi:hypothetical protein
MGAGAYFYHCARGVLSSSWSKYPGGLGAGPPSAEPERECAQAGKKACGRMPAPLDYGGFRIGGTGRGCGQGGAGLTFP